MTGLSTQFEASNRPRRNPADRSYHRPTPANSHNRLIPSQLVYNRQNGGRPPRENNTALLPIETDGNRRTATRGRTAQYHDSTPGTGGAGSWPETATAQQPVAADAATETGSRTAERGTAPHDRAAQHNNGTTTAAAGRTDVDASRRQNDIIASLNTAVQGICLFESQITGRTRVIA